MIKDGHRLVVSIYLEAERSLIKPASLEVSELSFVLAPLQTAVIYRDLYNVNKSSTKKTAEVKMTRFFNFQLFCEIDSFGVCDDFFHALCS